MALSAKQIFFDVSLIPASFFPSSLSHSLSLSSSLYPLFLSLFLSHSLTLSLFLSLSHTLFFFAKSFKCVANFNTKLRAWTSTEFQRDCFRSTENIVVYILHVLLIEIIRSVLIPHCLQNLRANIIILFWNYPIYFDTQTLKHFTLNKTR